MNEPKIYLENIHSSTPEPKKKKPKEKKQKEASPSSRKIPFRKKSYENGLTIFLYSLFILAVLIGIMNIGRMNTFIDMANRKTIDPTQLVSKIKQDEGAGKVVAFQGQEWLKLFFSSPKEEGAIKIRAKELASYVASDVDLERASSLGEKSDRSLQAVSVIDQQEENHSGKPKLYRTLYSVTFKEGGKPITIQIRLTAVYQKAKMFLVELPAYTNTERNKHVRMASPYSEEELWKQGKEVTATENKQIQKFVQQFFPLYVRNDSNLGLISSVSGLGNATFETATIDNVVRQGSTYAVQGTYTFYYTKGVSYTSQYSMELRQNNGSYYVEKMNE